jgi:hypothetical protein
LQVLVQQKIGRSTAGSHCEASPELLFTENETNVWRLFGSRTAPLRKGNARQRRLGRCGKGMNGQSLAFCCREMVKFPGVARRTATSIVLLTALLAGITPTGLCTLLCERHSRAESQSHCSQPSGSMSGMVHDHSAMNYSRVQAMSVLMSQSCQTNCATTERLSVWRRIVPQVTAVRSDAVVLGTTAEFLAHYFTSAWGLDSGPPTRSPARAASFSILRI